MANVKYVGATALTKKQSGGAFSIAMPAYQANDICVLMMWAYSATTPATNGGNAWSSGTGFSGSISRGFTLTLRSRVLTGSESPTSLDWSFGPDDGFNKGWFMGLVFRVPNYSSVVTAGAKDTSGADQRTVTFAADAHQVYQEVEVVAVAGNAVTAVNGVDKAWAASAPPTYTDGLTADFVLAGEDSELAWVWPNFPAVASKVTEHVAVYYRLNTQAVTYGDDTVTWDWAGTPPDDAGWWEAGYSRRVLRTSLDAYVPPPVRLGLERPLKVRGASLPYQLTTGVVRDASP